MLARKDQRKDQSAKIRRPLLFAFLQYNFISTKGREGRSTTNYIKATSLETQYRKQKQAVTHCFWHIQPTRLETECFFTARAPSWGVWGSSPLFQTTSREEQDNFQWFLSLDCNNRKRNRGVFGRTCNIVFNHSHPRRGQYSLHPFSQTKANQYREIWYFEQRSYPYWTCQERKGQKVKSDQVMTLPPSCDALNALLKPQGSVP